MVTEILGILIVIGAVMVLLLRYFSGKRAEQRKREQKAEQMEVGAAAVQLRRELERAADGIIERMGERVDRLEQLIAEATRREAALRARIRELEARERHIPETSFESALANHMNETAEMPMPAHVEAVELANMRIETPSARLSRNIGKPAEERGEEIVEKQQHIELISVEETPFVPEPAADSEDVESESPEIEAVAAPAEEVPFAAAESINASADETPILPAGHEGEGLADETLISDSENESNDSVHETSAPNSEHAPDVLSETTSPNAPQQEPSTRDVAAALLEDGMEVEEVARVTGIGRGALELLQRMQAK
ncbi:hypothetical protein TAMA11512_06550 [Selenomonas sp. TAMA-11512]|uniref:hypothetical protein n=1 Tax=Selenomonas sp. TAMA-11512 TaxID=3095337 RepID=UPI0030872839|nr:hypothetical protein TAMA11512_06550 [Selenomonas sp. TAMA-11512]